MLNKHSDRITFDLQKSLAKSLKDYARKEGESVACVIRKILKGFFQ